MDGKRNIRHFFILSFALMLFAGQWQAYGEGRATREHVFNKLEFANDSFPNAFKRLASDYTKEQRKKYISELYFLFDTVGRLEVWNSYFSWRDKEIESCIGYVDFDGYKFFVLTNNRDALRAYLIPCKRKKLYAVEPREDQPSVHIDYYYEDKETGSFRARWRRGEKGSLLDPRLDSVKIPKVEIVHNGIKESIAGILSEYRSRAPLQQEKSDAVGYLRFVAWDEPYIMPPLVVETEKPLWDGRYATLLITARHKDSFRFRIESPEEEQRQKQKKLLCYTIVDNTIFYINCPLNAIPDFFEVTERACPLPLIPSGVETLEELDRGKPSYADLFLLTRAYCSNAGMGGEWRLNACSGRQPYSDLELPLYVDVPRQAFSH